MNKRVRTFVRVSTSSVHLSGEAGDGDGDSRDDLDCLSLRQGLQVLADEVAALLQLQGPLLPGQVVSHTGCCSSRDCRVCLVHRTATQG